MPLAKLALAAVAAPWFGSVMAQRPALAPTANTVISTGAALHYSSITIPAGVTVTFTGTAPAVVRCDGDCIVHGTLSAAGATTTDGPGAVRTGAGLAGFSCNCIPWTCGLCGGSASEGDGRHYGVYGGAVPFSLDGGSPSGGFASYNSSSLTACCNILWASGLPAGGGGTLALLVDGRIDVHGAIDVRGGNRSPASGSAGSLLLRGAAGFTLHPTGQLFGGPASAAGGYVRVDAWGAPPVVQGTILAPPPVVLELPYLVAPPVPRIGSTWTIDVYAPAGSLVALAASTLQGTGAATPFGPLGIDIATSATVATTAAVGTHDPRATIGWVIPNAPALLGLLLWLQGFAVPQLLSPRLTNVFHATVQ